MAEANNGNNRNDGNKRNENEEEKNKKMITIFSCVSLIVIVLIFLPGIIANKSLGSHLCWYVVDEGYVGITYVRGALKSEISDPGLHFKLPYPFMSMSSINVRPQIDEVLNVPCGTADSVALIFENIKIGNTLNPKFVTSTVKQFGENYDNYLIYEKVMNQMQVICTNFSHEEVHNTSFHLLDDKLQTFLTQVQEQYKTGVTIEYVQLTKPKLPEGILNNLKKIAEERSVTKRIQEEKKRIAEQAERDQLSQKSVETLELMKVNSEANKMLVKLKNDNVMKIAEQETQQLIANIVNSMIFNKANVTAEAHKLELKAKAQGLVELHQIPGYVKIQLATQMALAFQNNSKFILSGENIPKILPFTTMSVLTDFDHLP